ncbi:MAG: hypothetical protein ACRCWJ_08785 [Casimicrobium sp.]
MELFQVQPHEIDRAWKDGAHKLSEATKWASREITPDQLKMLLARGERVLIGARDETGVHGWAAVGVVQMPNIRVLHIYSLQGKGVCSMEGLNLLKAYAYSLGCTSIRGACRASMVRFAQKFGAKPVYTTIELEVA